MKYLIFGGAGFIGVNAAHRLAEMGEEVIIADNLSRRGSESNLAWIRQHFPAISYIHCDVRRQNDIRLVFQKVTNPDVVLHLAAQVAVTTSVTDPRTDFDINALGTFNVLEVIREAGIDPVLIYSSTNKVYGEMDHIPLEEHDTRWMYKNASQGISEECPLDFHSPYGCSKGCADQYVRDYARIYGLRSVVFRQSAIFGPRQFGIEDQGWAAWFTIAALKGKPLTIYGDGKQVRDLLWVHDLIDAYLAAVERIGDVKGEVFNIGGGPDLSVSIWKEFEPILSRELGVKPIVSYQGWRPGDQKVCIMNINKAKQQLHWAPKVSIEEGMKILVQWVRDNLNLFEGF
ncbi:MAG: NAD-dependent epimerase/dehydratase family protein [bacterium]|jgi:CDP-paratose 2-epimerase